MKQVYLAFGSNLGSPLENIRKALGALPDAGVEVRRVSSFYRTEPVELIRQPWFVNCVAEAATDLMPLQLLKAVQRVERALGRRRVIDKGPRTIDIDILLYENVVVQSNTLKIPHEGLSHRRFVLVPLSELDRNLRHPVTRRTVLEMLGESPDHSQVIRMDLESEAALKGQPERAANA
ncbi:MAG TPA: 2-amino-4-hydroxy-6-hydroxymethyldihydropteridine diphosphokinase [Terriglobia bacterium]|nr:2-amino-4-hydroxy-6-hydroxymethyldihydropteridine diphosphokinase [Terriglobia bacterium]